VPQAPRIRQHPAGQGVPGQPERVGSLLGLGLGLIALGQQRDGVLVQFPQDRRVGRADGQVRGDPVPERRHGGGGIGGVQCRRRARGLW
jgi:hypothetical protein